MGGHQLPSDEEVRHKQQEEFEQLYNAVKNTLVSKGARITYENSSTGTIQTERKVMVNIPYPRLFNKDTNVQAGLVVRSMYQINVLRNRVKKFEMSIKDDPIYFEEANNVRKTAPPANLWERDFSPFNLDIYNLTDREHQ